MLHCLTAEESRELRDFLRDSGYTMAALSTRFGHTEISQSHLLTLYLLGVPLEPSRLPTLFRWFWIGVPVDRPTAAQFIPDRILDLLLASGLLVPDPGGLASPIRLSPFNEFFIASDHAVSRAGALHADTVLWPNPTSLMCHHLSMPAPVGRTLDLGTGNGVIALAAASHSSSVIATDLNPRAREFCLFNAALNGVSNIQFREGSAFEPVRGERFDLILANPPFFVTPSVRRVYSDNSMELDGFCRTLIQQAPEYLNENGYCQMLIEWVQIKGQPWRERLAEWVAGLECDVWVMSAYTRSIADYSLIRVQDDRADPAAQAAQVTSWLSYFESRQVEAIYGGVVTLRRKSGRHWVRMEELQAELQRPFGAFLRRVFDNRDYLDTHNDEQLLETRPSLAPSAGMIQRFAISPEGWKLASLDLHLNEGLPYTLALQPQVADFVALCNGQRTLREIADQTAAANGVDPELVRRESCRIVRQFADRGMLTLPSPVLK
jgi:methylase of polypeptide subunit release factors